MIGTGTFEITREEIQSLSYLRNPRTAAQYLGIPQTQVEDVWAKMSPPRKRHSGYTFKRETSGLSQLASHHEDAFNGSSKLLHAYSLFFARWEKEHGFREGAGKMLVPAGFCP